MAAPLQFLKVYLLHLSPVLLQGHILIIWADSAIKLHSLSAQIQINCNIIATLKLISNPRFVLYAALFGLCDGSLTFFVYYSFSNVSDLQLVFFPLL